MNEDQKQLLENHEDVSRAQESPDHVISGCYIPCRYVLIVMIFLGNFSCFCVRSSYNIAIVAMVNFTEINKHDKHTSHDCPIPNHNTSNHRMPKSIPEGRFDWDANIQGLLLGCFFYGNPVLQIPAGYLADRYGGKYIYGCAILLSGLTNLSMPLLAGLSPYALVSARIFQGLVQGLLVPAGLSLIGKWFPPKERTTAFLFNTTGYGLGTVTSLVLSGYLCSSSYLGGWPSVFYLFGGLSVVMGILWLPLVYSKPCQHPRISLQEKEYIEQDTSLGNAKCPRPPWWSIVTSGPFWGVLIERIVVGLPFYIVYTSVSLYMKQVLHFNISKDGLLSASPFIPPLVLSVPLGMLVDFISRKQYLRLVNIRRLAVIIGEFIPGLLLLLVAFVGCNAPAVITLLIANRAISTILNAGPPMSLYDIAPIHAGTLMGIVNGLGNVGGFVTPQLVAAITGDSPNQKRWRAVFYCGATGATVGTIVYCLFISDQVQYWAKPNPEQGEEE